MRRFAPSRFGLLLSLFLLLGSGSAFGSAWWVSPDGDDSGPGSRDRPWKSPGPASKKLAAGDTLTLLPGTYLLADYGEDMLVPPVSGRADAWITIRGEGEPRPVLKGSGNLLAAIDLAGRSYIRVEHLEFCSEIDSPYSGGMRGGIDAGGSAEPGKGGVAHLHLADLEVHHVEEAGINFSGSVQDTLVERVYVHHTGGSGISAPAAVDGQGWMRVRLDRCRLEQAGLFSGGKEDPSGWDRPDGFGIEASEGPLEISHCISRGNLGDGLDSKARRTYIHHCTVADNFGDGVKLWGRDSRVENTLVTGTGFPKPREGSFWQLLVIDTKDRDARFRLANVTLWDDPRRANRHYPMTVQYDSRDVPIIVEMANCIVGGLGTVWLSGQTRLEARHTLFANIHEGDETVIEREEKPEFTRKDLGKAGAGVRWGDPAFVRPEWGPKGDFHLKPASPARDSGQALESGTTDLDGRPRPQGPGWDLGAFEE